MLERIVASLTDRGCLLDPQAAQYITQQPQPELYLETALGRLHELPFIITVDTLRSALDNPLLPVPGNGNGNALRPQPMLTAQELFSPDLAEVMPKSAAQLLVPQTVTGAMRRSLASEHPAEVRVLKDSSTTPRGSGDVKDFVRYFQDRLEQMTRLLKQRREVANAVRIKDVARAGRDIQLIGLVQEKSKRPSGHRFLTLEDATGEIDVLFPIDKPELGSQFDTLLSDEVVGVVGHPTKDGSLVIAEALIRPDVPFLGERPRPEIPLYAGFLSDVHVGSRTFLSKEFRRMVKWFQGDVGSERERNVAKSTKYMVFAGDLVDGVGVYPGQQEGLEIEDVFKQYQRFAEELAGIPEHVHMVFLPGNHDASRPTEPQPALAKEIKTLFDRHETTFVSNPSLFSLHGVKTLGYHGYSMIDFCTSVPGLKMDQPIPVMKQMLQCRHIAPAYGGKTPLNPEERDFLVIDQVPDIFVTGHVHVAALEKYKNVTLVNGGTWQSQTDYQKMQNLVPTPARMPLINLSTLAGSMIDFAGA